MLDAVAKRVQIEDCSEPDCQGEEDRILTKWENAEKALTRRGFAINDYGMKNVYTVCGDDMEVNEFNNGIAFWTIDSLSDNSERGSKYVLFENGMASVNDDFELFGWCGCYRSCIENYYPVRCVKD